MTSAETKRYMAGVWPDLSGWNVSCSCGYLVTGWPTQAVAQADVDNHVSRAHEREDLTPPNGTDSR